MRDHANNKKIYYCISIIVLVCILIVFSVLKQPNTNEFARGIEQLNSRLPMQINELVSWESATFDKRAKVITYTYKVSSDYGNGTLVQAMYSTIFPKMSKKSILLVLGAADSDEWLNMLIKNKISRRIRWVFDDGREIFDFTYSPDELICTANGNKVDQYNDFYTEIAKIYNEICPFQISEYEILSHVVYEKGNPLAKNDDDIPTLCRMITVDADIAQSLSSDEMEEYLSFWLTPFIPAGCFSGMGYRLRSGVMLLDQDRHLINGKMIIINQ